MLGEVIQHGQQQRHAAVPEVEVVETVVPVLLSQVDVAVDAAGQGAAEQAGEAIATGRDQGTTPQTCTQAHLDTWIATGNTSRQGSRAFIAWAGRNGGMPCPLRLPYHQRTPRDTVTQGQRLQLLRTLFDPDAKTFLRDRAAALLLALFAQPPTRIASLTMNVLDITGEEVRIALGPHGPVPLTEPFGNVLREHATNRGPRNVTANQSSPWLFPGNRLVQHIHPTYLMNQLASNGTHLLGTRLAAIRALVQENATRRRGPSPGLPTPPTELSSTHPEPDAGKAHPMLDESVRPLSDLHPGERVQATITGHHLWGITAKIHGYEPVGASLDVIRRRSEPGVRQLAQDLPPVDSTVELVVGEVRSWHQAPWI
ncbi:hypothetical protein [Streptomyces sp. NBC_01190]|uniref:hypothetical protein n=1 Tax=Streptomyces sp. NBC_01190 TaxID=2903767 RepID=UPI003866E2C4|nr:hypothetical protein OG519_00170 [Streptomyces sp. NBC_01190]